MATPKAVLCPLEINILEHNLFSTYLTAKNQSVNAQKHVHSTQFESLPISNKKHLVVSTKSNQIAL
jgi:hypothetical protein